MPPDDKPPLGAIFNTNSRGRFDLLIYDDGLLAVKGSYLGVMLRGAGAGLVGGAGGLAGGALAGAGAKAGSVGAKSYEDKRLARLLTHPRAELTELDPVNEFIPADTITRSILRKRWHGCSLTVITTDGVERTYSWKPALNNFQAVHDALANVFGARLIRE